MCSLVALFCENTFDCLRCEHRFFLRVYNLARLRRTLCRAIVLGDDPGVCDKSPAAVMFVMCYDISMNACI